MRQYYITGLLYFSQKIKRSHEENVEYDLYDSFMELARLLKDTKSSVHENYQIVQKYHHDLYNIYYRIAGLLEEHGDTLLAIQYYNLACDEIKEINRKGVIGIFPLTARFKIPELYVNKGWYEMARDDYRLLMDEDYLVNQVTGGRTEIEGVDDIHVAFKLLTDDGRRKAFIGYLVADDLSKTAMSSGQIQEDGVVDSFKSKYGKYKDFEVVDNKIYAKKIDGDNQSEWLRDLVDRGIQEARKVEELLADTEDTGNLPVEEKTGVPGSMSIEGAYNFLRGDDSESVLAVFGNSELAKVKSFVETLVADDTGK